MVLFKRLALLLEVGCFFALIEICIWRSWPLHASSPRWPFLVGIALAMAASCMLSRDTLSSLGFKPIQGGASHIAALGTVANLAVLVALGLAYNKTGIRPLEELVPRALWYLPWALAQQLAMNGFFTNRLYASFGKGSEWATAMTAGALFAVAHAPNPALFAFAFINGAFGARIFIAYRNIYVLAIAHALLGPAVALLLPGSWHRGLVVGPGFFMK